MAYDLSIPHLTDLDLEMSRVKGRMRVYPVHVLLRRLVGVQLQPAEDLRESQVQLRERETGFHSSASRATQHEVAGKRDRGGGAYFIPRHCREPREKDSMCFSISVTLSLSGESQRSGLKVKESGKMLSSWWYM